jgi:hypothetical protein
MTDQSPQLNPRKIRIGLVLIAVVFVAAVVLFIVVDSAVARAIFFALGVLAIVRAVSLVRWLRGQRAVQN